MWLTRWRLLLPALWAGGLLCVALLATPAPFAMLAPADAGRVVGRMLAQEAYSSLALGIVMLVLERVAARRASAAGAGPQFTVGMALALGALFCTVAGYFAVQPMMAAARAGQGPLGFMQLHAISAAFYVVKTGLVLALAWRASRPTGHLRPSTSS
jgi:Domain of unknown function (DUF4149)